MGCGTREWGSVPSRIFIAEIAMKVSMRLAAVLFCSALSLLAGDLTIVFKNSGKMEGTSTTYYSSAFHRHNTESTRTDQLTDFKAGMMYTIKHKDRKIEKMSFDDLVAAFEGMQASLENMPAFLRKAMGGDGDTFTVDEVGKDTVANRKCKVFKILVGKLEMEVANDPTLQIPVPQEAWANYAKVRGMAMGAMASYKRLYEEMSKLKGVPLRTRTKFPIVGEITQEAVEVKEGAIPAAVFALPEGYKVEDAGKKLREQMAKGR